jgi:hypothetical protein
VFLSQLVEDVCCVEAGVVAQLTRDDLQRLRHRSDNQLLLASNSSKEKQFTQI